LVTKGQVFGIHLGQRVDGRNRYNGAFDEFRLWRRALDQDEIKILMTQGQALILAIHPTGHLTTTWGTIKNQ